MPVLSEAEGLVPSKNVSETTVGQRPTPSLSTRIRPSGKGFAPPPHEGALPPDVPSTLSTSARIPPLGGPEVFYPKEAEPSEPSGPAQSA
jgi:hypothetical protein